MLARPQERGCSVIDVVRMSVPWNARFQRVKMRFWDSFPHGVETIFFEIWKFSQTAGFWGLPIFLRQTYEGLSSDPDFILTKVGKKPTTMGLFYGTGMYNSITKMTAYFPKQVYLYGVLAPVKGLRAWAAWFWLCPQACVPGRVGAVGRMILHLSPACLSLVPHSLPVRCGCSGLHDSTLVSYLSPTLSHLSPFGCLGRMVLHLSPVCLPFISHYIVSPLAHSFAFVFHFSPVSIFGLRVFSQYGASGCTWPILFAKGVSPLRAKRARSLEWKNFLCNYWSPTCFPLHSCLRRNSGGQTVFILVPLSSASVFVLSLTCPTFLPRRCGRGFLSNCRRFSDISFFCTGLMTGGA